MGIDTAFHTADFVLFLAILLGLFKAYRLEAKVNDIVANHLVHVKDNVKVLVDNMGTLTADLSLVKNDIGWLKTSGEARQTQLDQIQKELTVDRELHRQWYEGLDSKVSTWMMETRDRLERIEQKVQLL